MKMEHTTRKRRQGTAGNNRSLLARNHSVQGRRNTGNSISDSAKKKPLPLPLRKTVSHIIPRTCSNLSGQESDDGVDIEVEVDLERDGTAVVKKVLQQQEDDDGDNKKKIDEILAMQMSDVPLIVEECLEDDEEEEEEEEEEKEEDDDDEEEERICDNKNKRMQSIVDLVMWRDVSRSAFVFGIGSFLVISSSYTKDFNFSLISTLSYLGLFYLGTIFLYTSIATDAKRSTVLTVECREKRWVITEEDATQLIHKLLPYINDILIKTKTLFSGDPATTIKAATPLFLLARYGGIFPISTMLKLAFFGAFIVPKFASAYSVHIQRYATFLLHRSRDAWDTCTHKKAAAATTFAVLWNLSSPPARTWIAFMMLVFVRYYHQITGGRDLAGDLTATSATEEKK